MVSSALATLRGMPQEQADVYNAYLPACAKIRLNPLLSNAGRLQKIADLMNAAVSDLQDVLTRSNAAEKKVRAALTSTATATPEDVASMRWAIDSGISLINICQQLVNDNNRSGFLALRQLLPWEQLAHKLVFVPGQSQDAYDRAMAQARTLIAAYEQQLFTPAEKALADEVTECDISMPYLRLNHTTLTGFFQKQTQASTVAGTFTRVASLYRWQGLPGDNLPKGMMQLLADETVGMRS